MTARTPVQRQQSLAARKRAAGLTEVRSLWAPKEQHKAIRAMAADPAMQADALRYRWLRDRKPGGMYRIAGLIYSDGNAAFDAAIDAAMAAGEKT